MFCFACLSVLLKEPRLIAAFIGRNFAFSSYFSGCKDKLTAKTTIRRDSSCVAVKWLFLESVLKSGSVMAVFNQLCTLSLRFKLFTLSGRCMDTVLYTSGI